MKKFTIYLDGRYFFEHEAETKAKAIEKKKDQIENLHPLNYSIENLESYRDRFRNRKIEAFERGENNPYIKQ